MSTVLIIDDQYTIRIGLSAILRRQFPDIRIYEEENTRAVKSLLDIDLIIWEPVSSRNGLVFHDFMELKKRTPNTRILLHSACRHTEFDLLEYLSAGAMGFLHKTAGPSEYLTAVATIMEGRPYLAHNVKADMIRMLNQRK